MGLNSGPQAIGVARNFRVGEEVFYRKQSTGQWIPTSVAVVHSDGSIELQGKPGEKFNSGFLAIQKSKPGRTFNVGDQVLYISVSEGRGLETQVSVVHRDGSFEIAFKPGERFDPRNEAIHRKIGNVGTPYAAQIDVPRAPMPAAQGGMPGPPVSPTNGKQTWTLNVGEEVYCQYTPDNSNAVSAAVQTKVTGVHTDGTVEVLAYPGQRIHHRYIKKTFEDAMIKM